MTFQAVDQLSLFRGWPISAGVIMFQPHHRGSRLTTTPTTAGPGPNRWATKKGSKSNVLRGDLSVYKKEEMGITQLGILSWETQDELSLVGDC